MNKILLLFQCLLALAMMGKLCSVELPYVKVRLSSNSYSPFVINNPSLDKGLNVRSVAEKYNLSYVVNGGYYGLDKKPIGYLKINGKIINEEVNKAQSGMLVFNKDGNVDVLWAKNTTVGNWETKIQNGPFVIDPGGTKGIRSNDGESANRVCVGKYVNGDIFLVYANKIILFDLADSLLINENGIDSVLNMDGGPMAGVWSSNDGNFQIVNNAAAANYVGFMLKSVGK